MVDEAIHQACRLTAEELRAVDSALFVGASRHDAFDAALTASSSIAAALSEQAQQESKNNNVRWLQSWVSVLLSKTDRRFESNSDAISAAAGLEEVETIFNQQRAWRDALWNQWLVARFWLLKARIAPREEDKRLFVSRAADAARDVWRAHLTIPGSYVFSYGRFASSCNCSPTTRRAACVDRAEDDLRHWLGGPTLGRSALDLSSRR